MKIPTLSGNQVLILELMLQRPQGVYGLELCRAAAGQLSRGGIYITLQRMVERGLIEPRETTDPRTGGLPRRLYFVEGRGKAALAAHRARAAAFAAAMGSPQEALG